MKQLSEDQIREMRTVRDNLITHYGERDRLLERYEEVYFMKGEERPKGLKIDEQDIKITVSSSGRDAVIGLKRILDSGDVQIKVEGEGGNQDKVEAGLKTMLRASGQYKIASVEKDLNLSAALHGPASLAVELVDDLIETQSKTTTDEYGNPKKTNEYVVKQLEVIKKESPFILHAVSARQSYPLFGAYGMIGFCRKYKLRGVEIADRWGVDCKDPTAEYDVKDFFYYEKRLVEADGITEPLMAVEWVTRDPKGEIIGSINIPVFTRFSGGSSLFDKPEDQSQPLLYAKVKGNWDKRENLFWTYLFTGIDQQGIPGPVLMLDPESSTDFDIEYRRGIRVIHGKGQLADNQVIDGDVLRMSDMLKSEAAAQTIQPQTLGQNTGGVTFSQFALASKAGLIPAIDPKEAMEALYADAFRHILQRIKTEDIQNDLIQAVDIPEKFKLTVTLAPDLEQDDLRNAQIATQLLNSGATVSKEWVNSNILKIADTGEMYKQKKIEELMDAMIELMKAPEKLMPVLESFSAKPQGQQGQGQQGQGQQLPPLPGSGMPGQMPEGMPQMPGMEQMPQTDPMIPPNERQ